MTTDAHRRRRDRRQHVRVHRLREAGVDRRHPRDGAAEEDGNCTRLVVTGCLGERYRDELKKEIPEIDAVLGTGEVDRIVGALEGPAAGRAGGGRTDHAAAAPSPLPRRRTGGCRSRPGVAGTAPAGLPTYLYDAETPRLLTTPRHFAYVKIAEGCDYTCAFCIIPTLRGKYRSRDAASIVREARGLAARGVKELLLISQDTTFYGIDRGERGALARLLRELNAVDGLEWIRLLYLYPTTITDDVLEAMAECEKVCQLHRPAAAARVRGRAQADAPARATARPTTSCSPGSAPRARRHAADDLHRRLPRRDRGGVRRARAASSATRGSTTSACSPTRTRKARARTRWPTTCRRRSSAGAATR